MNREKALALVKGQLTEKRYIHTIGVMETSIALAKRYGADPKKAELAAIFHDYAKFRPEEEMKRIILEQNMPKDLLEYHPELWHAPVGAFLAGEEAGITDKEIVSAIRYHTTGRAGMALLDKIVFLADYIEPGRSFPGVDAVRECAEKSLDAAVFMALKNTISFLLSKNASIYPDTFHAYNDYINKNKLEE